MGSVCISSPLCAASNVDGRHKVIALAFAHRILMYGETTVGLTDEHYSKVSASLRVTRNLVNGFSRICLSCLPQASRDLVRHH